VQGHIAQAQNSLAEAQRVHASHEAQQRRGHGEGSHWNEEPRHE
jgi:hypothetical protein